MDVKTITVSVTGALILVLSALAAFNVIPEQAATDVREGVAEQVCPECPECQVAE